MEYALFSTAWSRNGAPAGRAARRYRPKERVVPSFALFPASSVTSDIAMRILTRSCTALLMAAVCSAQSASQTQTIWFCPIIPAAWNNFIGSLDYLDLFAPGAPWTTASSHVQIFKMYTQMIVPSFPGLLLRRRAPADLRLSE